MGQNLAHASTVHALNLTCFHAVQFRHWVGYCVAFCFKKHSSLNLKPKTQALKCFEGCSAAAGQHVLAVLTTGYGKKLGRSTSSCCQTCRKSECFSVLRWKSRVYHNCCLAVIGPGTPDFGFEQEWGRSSFILTSVRDLGERAEENLTILKAWPRPMFTALRLFVVLVQDVQASSLPPRSYVSNKAFRELLLSKLYHKNVVCVVADEVHCNIDW